MKEFKNKELGNDSVRSRLLYLAIIIQTPVLLLRVDF